MQCEKEVVVTASRIRSLGKNEKLNFGLVKLRRPIGCSLGRSCRYFHV